MCSWRKRKETASKKDEKKYTCLFCKKTFTKDEIVFGLTLKTPDPAYNDVIFNQQLANYQHKSYTDENGVLHGLRPVSRRMIDLKSEKTKIISFEANGLPLVVEGPLISNEQRMEIEDDGLSFSENDNSHALDAGEEEIVRTTERLCPHCHFTLPKGFADDKVFQIGLIGGSRSGKTTYMAVVTEYLQKKMWNLNSGLDLAEVELLPECKKDQEALYYSQRNPLGAEADAIVGEIKGQMIMPIIMRIRPEHEEFKPFFIAFQDIPGEYLLPENRHFLINSNIPLSNHIIFLIDINHFIKTEQQEDGSEFGAYCTQDVNDLFANIEALGEVIPPNQLKSIQCTLTKLDFWIKEDPHLSEAQFTRNCDEAHKEAINVDRLEIVHNQLIDYLNSIGGSNQSGLLDNLLARMHIRGETVHRAYTAIASRIVPGHEEQIRQHGADYQSSLNVLEPLMNIFDWEDALPEKGQV